MDTIRNPVIPVSYDEKYKALKKELVYKYNKESKTVDLFIVSPDDKSLLIDITSNIRDKINNLGADVIYIDIEGLGNITIKELLINMNKTLEKSVRIQDTGKKIAYISNVPVLDEKSLDINSKQLVKVAEIKGFGSADNNSMLVKRDGKLQWLPLISSENSTVTDPTPYPSTGGDTNTGGSGDIIQPGNPDDGLGLKCTIIEPADSRLYLRASRRQKTLFISGADRVILPTPYDEKSDIEWLIVTNDTVPTLSFPVNVFWKELPKELPKNSMTAYSFKTWDGGRTWAGSYDSYANNSANAIITKEFLDSNYYTKKEIQDLLSWGGEEPKPADENIII